MKTIEVREEIPSVTLAEVREQPGLKMRVPRTAADLLNRRRLSADTMLLTESLNNRLTR